MGYFSPMERQAAPNDVSDFQERRDLRTLEAIARGDEGAFAELFRRYGPSSLALAKRILGDQQHAEDVVQDVFGSVWRRAARFDPARGRVRSWLLAQIHHRAVDLVRREEAERRRPATSVLPSVPAPDEVVEEAWLADRRRRVAKALQELSDEQRDMLELAYFRGLTQSQVAAARSIPLGTVKSRTLAGLRRLRSILGEEP